MEAGAGLNDEPLVVSELDFEPALGRGQSCRDNGHPSKRLYAAG